MIGKIHSQKPNIKMEKYLLGKVVETIGTNSNISVDAKLWQVLKNTVIIDKKRKKIKSINKKQVKKQRIN